MKHRKVYLVLFVMFIGALIWLVRDVLIPEGVAVGYTVNAEERPSEWNSIISEEVNSDIIKLVVDGINVDFGQELMYMDSNMNLMIPLYVFKDTFNCSINGFEKNNVRIQKGNTVVTGNINENIITVNSDTYQITSPVQVVEDELYIQARVLEKAFDYSYMWDIGSNSLFLIDNNKSESILPSRFSYREIGKLPSIKNQGNLSTCWAFASLTALETTLMPDENYVFSVDNMSNNNGYKGTQNEGGDYTRAMAYLASWRGPILEEDDPYGDGKFTTDVDAMKHVQEMQIIDGKNFEAIKKAVFLYGGVQSSLYTSMTTSNASSAYYNLKNTAYCYIGTAKPNHDVVIVGWDDNYSKDNFNGNLDGDGAFICMNSWGSDFGDDGLFYVSYYDSNIGMRNVVYTKAESADNYDSIYQSDICGWVGQLGYDSETAYFANVYTAKENENIEAVGFYATGKNTKYEIYFVEDFGDESSLDSRLFVQSGSFSNAGYYTVDLDKSCVMETGKDYAIVIKITTPNSIHPVAIEYKAGYSTSNVDLTDGNGYVSLSGRSWEHVEESKNCNVCLKLYTNKIN